MAEKNKIMLVTCGISLFQSASWLPGEWTKEIPEYENWLKEGTSREPGPLISPRKRISDENSNKIRSYLESRLKIDNAEYWANYFAKDIQKKPYTLRYSAELSSIFEFAMKKAYDWRNYLSQFHIQFLTDESENSRSHIAAVHNLTYLQSIEDLELSDSIVQPFPGLSSNIADELKTAFDGLKKYFIEVYSNKKHHEIVIIISGGYKIYPLAFAEIFCPDLIKLEESKFLKIIYLHEEGESITEFGFKHDPAKIKEYDLDIMIY